MRRVWKLAIPLAMLIVVGGYAVGSLAASDLDDVTPRQPIVIGGDTGAGREAGPGERPTDDRRQRQDQKGEQRGDDGRTAADDEDADDDVDVVRPDVDDLDDDDEDDGDD